MRTDLLLFVLASESRKKIAKAILEYPNRLWSCPSLEEAARIPHATAFRTVKGLAYFGLLKSVKINKKDIAYELVKESPYTKELERLLSIEKITAEKIARGFIKKIKSKQIISAMLYGSTVSGDSKPESDIDILIVLDKRNPLLEKNISDTAAKLSSKLNKTLSITTTDVEELNKERKTQFMQSVASNMVVIYGKKLL